MDTSPKLIWGSPAIKDDSLSVNQRANNGDNPTFFNTTPQGRNSNNEGARLAWGSSMSPVNTYFGDPIGTSSPNSPYYGNDNGHNKSMSKGYGGGRNYTHDGGGPGGTRTPYNHSSSSPRFSSPNSSFGGRGRSFLHGSPGYKPNWSGGNNTGSRPSFYGSPRTPGRSFQRDSTPYCSPNSPNVSFNQSFTAEDYFRQSMLEDPWEKLRKRQQSD